MKKMFLLFSHKLIDEQISYAKNKLNIEEFIYLPVKLQNIWSNFDPDIEKLDLFLIEEFLKKKIKKDDFILIQGDFGACYSMVEFCKKLGAIPVYATTKRISKEYKNEDGKIEKKSIFKFRRFRKYGV